MTGQKKKKSRKIARKEKKSVLHRYKNLWMEIYKNAKTKYGLNQADKQEDSFRYVRVSAP